MIRLGLHRQSKDADERFIAYVDRVRPQIVKQLDDRSNDLAIWCKQRGTDTVARVYFDDQNLGRIGDRIGKVIEEARTTGAIKYWELDNEDHQSGRDMARYADACITLMQALDSLGQGQKAAIGSFSTGQPEIGEWVNFLPALKYAAAHGHAVALHEYGGAVMQWGAGNNQWNNGAYTLSDPCLRGDELGWWCLRYRRHVAEWRRLGLTTIPGIMITEGGLDDVQPRPGPQAKGYKDWVNTQWGNDPRFGDFAAQAAWYCRQISHDNYMIGAVDYGFATRDPAWNSFDLSTDPAMLGRMIDEMTRPDIGTPPPPPPPVIIPPTPPPTPPPVMSPDVGADVMPAIAKHAREGWYSIAGRAAGLPITAATFVERRRLATVLAAANGFRLTDAPPVWCVVPWAKVGRKE